MTWRSAALGFFLALTLAASGYYNDWVLLQQPLFGSLMPVAAFGVVCVLLLLVNPLLRSLGNRAPLDANEAMIVAAIILIASSFPGSAFTRLFMPMVAMPSHWMKNQPNWQSSHVLSYVPGGSAKLAAGQVRDWPALAHALREQGQQEVDPAAAVWNVMDSEERHVLDVVVAAGHAEHAQALILLSAINRWIDPPDRYDSAEISRQRRDELVEAYPRMVAPVPSGSGVLLMDGRSVPDVTDAIITGVADGRAIAVTALPWRAWWPTVRLWGGLFLLLALASLGMLLVVHPQWVRRERLAYPVVQFLELAASRSPGRILPDVAASSLFWIGLVAMLVVHGCNALNEWFPAFPVTVPLRYDFTTLMTLFPDAREVPGAWGLYRPFILPTAIAFAYFLTRQVSLSLGLSMPLFTFFGAMLISSGTPVKTGWNTAGNHNLMLLGAGTGLTLMMLYSGREHYLRVVRGAVGLGYDNRTPSYSIWGARLLGLCAALMVGVLHWLGVALVWAAVFVAMALLIQVVISRVNAETGALFVHVGWLPLTALAAVVGTETIGPTALIVLMMFSLIMMVDTSDAVMPQLTNALRLADRPGGLEPHRISPLVVGLLVIGLGVTVTATLATHYTMGMNRTVGWWIAEEVTQLPLDLLSETVADLSTTGRLQDATWATGMERLWLVDANTHNLTWLAAGLLLYVVCAAARLRFPWWPLHPVLFVFWGTFPSIILSVSLLIGWAVKTAIVKLGGEQAFLHVRPLMVGIIAGELLAAVSLIAIGASYHAATGLTLTPYFVFAR